MRVFELQIDITAPQLAVWSVVSDFENYSSWNPVVASARGRLDEGGPIYLKLRNAKNFGPVTIVSYEHGKNFVLSRSLLHPFLVHMEHFFELEQMDENVVRFTQRWHCRGLLIPFIWKKLTSKMKQFERFNDALKDYVEKAV